MKQQTLTFYYENCGECPNVEMATKERWKCLLKRKIVPDLWGEIPSWCLLKDKE